VVAATPTETNLEGSGDESCQTPRFVLEINGAPRRDPEPLWNNSPGCCLSS
jgi:hypothetical protein